MWQMEKRNALMTSKFSSDVEGPMISIESFFELMISIHRYGKKKKKHKFRDDFGFAKLNTDEMDDNIVK